jgi:hypothetical protein
MATIKIIRDKEQRITVDELDPTIHYKKDSVVSWKNTTNVTVQWDFAGAKSVFEEADQTVKIEPNKYLDRHIKDKPSEGNHSYTVAQAPMAAAAKAGAKGGSSAASKKKVTPAQPTPGLDIEP